MAITDLDKLYRDRFQAGSFQPTGTLNVDSVLGNDADANGSIDNPYKTALAAYTAAVPNTEIILHGFDGTEPVETLLIAKDNIYIRGDGSTGILSPSTILNAHITLAPGIALSGFRLEDLELRGQTPGLDTFTDIDTSSNHQFKSVLFSHAAPAPGDLVFHTQDGTVGAVTSFQDCQFTGDVTLDGTPTGRVIVFRFTSLQGTLTIDGVNFQVIGLALLNANIVHTEGVFFWFGGSFGGTVTSTASNPASLLGLSDITSLGAINKTGTCPYGIRNVNRAPLTDVLTGTNIGPLTWAEDQGTEFVPTNYATLTKFISDHLAGIDAALAAAAFPAGVLGDLLIHNGTSFVPLNIGTLGQELTSNGTTAIWATPPSGLPAGVLGDILVHNGTSFVPLAIGANGQELTSNGTTAVWATPPPLGALPFFTDTFSHAGSNVGTLHTITHNLGTTDIILVATYDNGGVDTLFPDYLVAAGTNFGYFLHNYTANTVEFYAYQYPEGGATGTFNMTVKVYAPSTVGNLANFTNTISVTGSVLGSSTTVTHNLGTLNIGVVLTFDDGAGDIRILPMAVANTFGYEVTAMTANDFALKIYEFTPSATPLGTKNVTISVFKIA